MAAEFIEIAALIVSAAQLVLDAGKVAAKATPDASSSLRNKSRWLQCTVKNETQFHILLIGTYFDSGRYWDAPGSIPPFSQMVFSVCEKDGSFMTGATGGTAFSLTLDDKHSYTFAIGWTCPWFGCIKAGVVKSNRAESGYDNATEEGSTLTSRQSFAGFDKDGKCAKFKIHISSAPGQNALYVVNQVLSYNHCADVLPAKIVF